MCNAAGSAEPQLWARVRDGDEVAFGMLFERHCDAIFNFAYRRIGRWDVAEDVVGQAFLEAWRQRNRITLVENSLRPWLFGTASNLVRRWWRTSIRGDRALDRLFFAFEDGVDPAGEVVEQLDDERRLDVVRRHLTALPEAQREVLLLWAWEELSYEQIALVLNVAVGTVRSRLHRARQALRNSAVDGMDPEHRACGPVQATSAATVRHTGLEAG